MFVYKFKLRNPDTFKICAVHKVLASNESQAKFFLKGKLKALDWYPSCDKRSFVAHL